MPNDDYSTWKTQALRDYEERLYDQEVAGEDVWLERDKVLWELSSRNPMSVAEIPFRPILSKG